MPRADGEAASGSPQPQLLNAMNVRKPKENLHHFKTCTMSEVDVVYTAHRAEYALNQLYKLHLRCVAIPIMSGEVQ